MKAIDLTPLKGTELVALHNAINPDAPVSRFKNNEAGQTALDSLIPEQYKGKNKAKFATQIATLPLSILAVLAAGIPVAKDLSTKLFPAHQRLLAALEDLNGNNKHAAKDKLATQGLGLTTGDANFATVLTELYNLNLVIWEENDDLMLTEVAHNFIEANRADFDMETPFADLVSEKVRAKKERKESDGARKHTPDTSLITPLIETNPCQAGKGRHASYEIWLGKTGKKRITVGAYKEAGGGMFDLLDAVKRERITIDPVDA